MSLNERVTYVSGKYVPESKACIHIYDSQFMFGDAVFEMHRTFKHEHFLFDEHIERLFASMKYASIKIDKTRDELLDICNELMERNKEHFPVDEEYRFMINVSRGPLPIYKEVFQLESGDDWNKPTWIVNAWPLSKVAKTMAHFYETGANSIVPSQRQIPSQFLDAKVKNRSRMHYNLANIEVSSKGKDAMALLLDQDGFITEGTGSNFVMIKDGEIIVPELRNLLRGCSMMYLINVIALQLGISVVQKNFEPYDVLCADEAFFTGTFVNLIPCNRINGHFLNEYVKTNVIGPTTRRICEQWASNVGVDFISQVKGWAKNV